MAGEVGVWRAPDALSETTKRVLIFVGPLGSGKTTVALNVASYLALAARNAPGPEGKKVFLVDLDLINPVFRSRVVRNELVRYGVEVIAPPAELAAGDLPAVPAAVKGALLSGYRVVLDVGGDGVGATVLGAYQPYLRRGEYSVFFVVNARRPFTQAPDEIGVAVKEVAAATRLNVDYLVNNTHLGAATSAAVVREGLARVAAAAASLGISVAFSAVVARLLPEMAEWEERVLPLKIFLPLPWQSPTFGDTG